MLYFLFSLNSRTTLVSKPIQIDKSYIKFHPYVICPNNSMFLTFLPMKHSLYWVTNSMLCFNEYLNILFHCPPGEKDFHMQGRDDTTENGKEFTIHSFGLLIFMTIESINIANMHHLKVMYGRDKFFIKYFTSQQFKTP